ncbi:TPM domain-containing protein [Acidobacteria bacterium AB60]|nr:TPM domain-containing protein [Acidobacteria bacterium AB60]
MVAGLLVFCGSRAIAETVEDLPKPTGYVSDYAHVLSPQAIARVDQIASQLDHSEARAQLAVVTVRTLDGADRDQFANDLFHKWGIGGKSNDRGVLILLSIQDHQRRIEVGYGLEGILNDAKAGDIGRSAVPYLRQNDYDEAVLTQVDQVGQVIADDAHVTLNEEPAPRPTARHAHRSSPFGGLIFLIILLVFFGGSWITRLLFGGLILNSLGGGWRGGGWGGGGWGSGGGWGGGGGDSGGGGGFGGFGGGDSGGGGAGGSW